MNETMEIKYRRDLDKLLSHLGIEKGDTVEVGCAEGFFSADILRMNIGHHYMVDNWATIPGITGDGNNSQEWHDKNYTDAMNRVLPEFNERVTVLRGMSVNMAEHLNDDTASLVYIDCDHSYEGVKADINAWYPKLIMGGVMAFHDYENPAYGVKQAVDEFAAANGLEVHFIAEDKPEDAGAWFQKK